MISQGKTEHLKYIIYNLVLSNNHSHDYIIDSILQYSDYIAVHSDGEESLRIITCMFVTTGS